MSPSIRRIKKALDIKQRQSMTMEHKKERDLYFKPGNDACMSFDLVQKRKEKYIWADTSLTLF
jgi:hypothetical protein